MVLFTYQPLNLRSAAFDPDPKAWPPGAIRRWWFGQAVLWHENLANGGRHLPPGQLEPYRQVGDPMVDCIFTLRQAEGRPVKAGEDLVAAAEVANAQSAVASERALHAWYQHYTTLPSWTAEPAVLNRGREVHLAYLPAISMSLYYRSLVPGFSIPKIAAVLAATGYLAPPATRQQVWNRLLDTGLWLLKCFTSTDTILPGGDGWKACLHVRVLHAKVRHGLLQRTQSPWDVATLGIPLNQEDMAATLLAFSLNALLGTEMLLGFPVPVADREAYLAIWRYLGWMLGVSVSKEDELLSTSNVGPTSTVESPQASLQPLDPCGSGWLVDDPNALQHSQDIFQSIILHLLHPDETSVRIAHHLLWQGRKSKATDNEKCDEERWFYYRALQCRRFVGDPLADALQLPQHDKWWRRIPTWLFSTTYLTILTCYSWAGLPWSPLRRALIQWHARHLENLGKTLHLQHSQRMQESLSAVGSCPFAMVASPS